MQRELIRAIATLRKGGPESLERALLYLQRTVFSFSLKLCGNRADAEDTAQETLLRVVDYLAHFDTPEALAVWLYKTAKSRCLMSRRRSKYAPAALMSVEGASLDPPDGRSATAAAAETPEVALAHREELHLLHEAILKLPSTYRVVLVLHDMEGLSAAETGQVLGLTEGAVRVRLHRARLLLRQELNQPGTLADGVMPISSRCRELARQLSECLDHRLADTLVEELARHLHNCTPCRELLADLEQSVERCRQNRTSPESINRDTTPRTLLLKQYQQVLARIRESANARHR